ncbi:hypothetical protein BDB01DRAFT_776547 [Pilobolus umbonatus]|nr:hypothetical protein BDB01DRAFT_776547 [Pilobolus umbonatus]
MAEEELDIYSDYNTDDIFDEIVNDKPIKKRPRNKLSNDEIKEEIDDTSRQSKVPRLNEQPKQTPQKIQTTTQAYQNSPSSHSRTKLPSALTQLRGISTTPTTNIYLGELHWYTTDEEVRAPLVKADIIDQLREMTFYEHKVNGKSKGIVYLEFTTADYATQAKDIYDHTEFDQKRVYAVYTNIANPFKHLPKETPSKPSRNTPSNNNNNNIRMTPMMPNVNTYSMMNNTGFNSGFAMPPYGFPNMNRNNYMFNDMMNMPPAGRGVRMRGNTNTNGQFNSRMNRGGNNGMYINPAFFDQQKQ